MGNKSIFWTKSAIKQFETAISFIASGSSVSAEKVSSAILKELNKTSKNAEFFAPDKYKKIMMVVTGPSRSAITELRTGLKIILYVC